MIATIQLSEKTIEFIQKQDEVLNKRAGYSANDLQKYVDNLLEFGKIEVGWREACGSTDPTMHIYRAWRKVLAKLKNDGFVITEESTKHGNGWATKCGGFWSSTIYRVGSIS